MSPSVGISIPPIKFNSVDFPHPEGPNININPFSLNSKFISVNAGII